MKHHLTITMLTSALMLGCTKDSMDYADTTMQNTTGGQPKAPKPAMRYTGPNYSQPISVVDANTMIQSYLNSINYLNNDTTIRSFTFDADTLRAYLQDHNIKTIKLMMAHKKSYIENGNYAKNAGTRASSITFVIVGLDDGDGYVLNAQNKVYDNMLPCPANCPNSAPTIQ